jgi:hypothetical protein
VRAAVVYLGCALVLAVAPMCAVALLPVPQAVVAVWLVVAVAVLAWRGLDMLLWCAVLSPDQRAQYRAARRRRRERQGRGGPWCPGGSTR